MAGDCQPPPTEPARVAKRSTAPEDLKLDQLTIEQNEIPSTTDLLQSRLDAAEARLASQAQSMTHFNFQNERLRSRLKNELEPLQARLNGLRGLSARQQSVIGQQGRALAHLKALEQSTHTRAAGSHTAPNSAELAPDDTDLPRLMQQCEDDFRKCAATLERMRQALADPENVDNTSFLELMSLKNRIDELYRRWQPLAPMYHNLAGKRAAERLQAAQANNKGAPRPLS